MSESPAGAASDRPVPYREVRYSLAQMLREVAEEQSAGAFGSGKVHQKDIAKIFRAKKTPANRARKG